MHADAHVKDAAVLFEGTSMRGHRTRDRHEIIAQILRSIQGEPITRTKIMYGGMLNFIQVTEILPILLDAELAVATPDRRYSITEKGRHYLALYDEVKSLIVPDIEA